MIWVSVSMMLLTFALGMLDSNHDTKWSYDLYFVSLVLTLCSWFITAVCFIFKK